MTVVTDAPIGQDVVGNVRLVAIDRLRTSYMRLRPGAVPPRIEQGSELPLRVAPCPDSTEHFELIDGFKRLGRWREQGATLVPVVVERPARAEEHKRLMLTVNAPARTTTVLDEGRVVCSLLDDDGMTPRQVSRLLGRKPAWVERRRDIGKRLSVGAEELVALGAVGPTLAHALSTLAHEEQDALLESVGKHGLRDRESLRLVQAWAVADAPDRKQLLRCPRGTVHEAPAATLSSRVVQLEAQLHGICDALRDLAAFQVPAELAPAEQRRLEALYRGAMGDVRRLASCGAQAAPDLTTHRKDQEDDRPTEPDYHCNTARAGQPAERRASAQAGPQAGGHPGRDTHTDPSLARLLQCEADLPPRRDEPQAGGTRAARARACALPAEHGPGLAGHRGRQQARPVPAARDRAGSPASDDDTHPSGDPAGRLPGGTHHPGRLRATGT